MDRPNVMLEVARVVANRPVQSLLRTSEIRDAGVGSESGGQRFREHALRFRLLKQKQSHEYVGDGRYRIFGDFKRYCQQYVRDHKKN